MPDPTTEQSPLLKRFADETKKGQDLDLRENILNGRQIVLDQRQIEIDAKITKHKDLETWEERLRNEEAGLKKIAEEQAQEKIRLERIAGYQVGKERELRTILAQVSQKMAAYQQLLKDTSWLKELMEQAPDVKVPDNVSPFTDPNSPNPLDFPPPTHYEPPIGEARLRKMESKQK